MILRAATLCFLLLLTACFGLEYVEKLRTAPPAASPFHQELARLYLDFVDKELDKYDWDSAGYFAQKGLEAAHGQSIEPEDPAKWDIPDYAIAELTSGRSRVLAKLTPAFMQSQPKSAALMVFSYDCWVEEQEEAWETQAIEACKQGMLRQFTETDPPVENMSGPLSTSYLFHFPDASTQLAGMAEDELKLMAKTLAEYGGPYTVVINGQADQPVGADLSGKRAAYIRSQLAKGGVPEKHISYNPYSDAAVASDAGGSGDRIEIFIE